MEEKVLGDAEAKRAQGGVDGFVIWKIRTVGRRLRVLTRLAGGCVHVPVARGRGMYRSTLDPENPYK